MLYREKKEISEIKRFFPVIFLIIWGISLLFLQKKALLSPQIRDFFYDHFHSPLRSLIYKPLHAFAEYQQGINQAENLQKTQLQLQQELRETKAQLQLLAHYQAENRRLRLLLESIPKNNSNNLLVAEIRDSSIDGYREEITINKGSQNDIFVNQAVIDSYGLVGQVIETKANEAQVLLISDTRSRVPVYVERTQQRAIASGGGGFGKLFLSDLRLDSDIQIGDRVITSGLGGIFPRGYPVAEVVAIKRHQSASFLEIKLNPLAKLDSMLEVLLINPQPQIDLIPTGPEKQ